MPGLHNPADCGCRCSIHTPFVQLANALVFVPRACSCSCTQPLTYLCLPVPATCCCPALPDCKEYSRGSNFPCNLSQGLCCQKGLSCVNNVCSVQPAQAETKPAPAAPPACTSYARGANFQCNIAGGLCCQKGLACMSGVCKPNAATPL